MSFDHTHNSVKRYNYHPNSTHYSRLPTYAFPMRLTNAQIETIRETTRRNFGEDALIWLFGSRVDNSRRGGDIDLYVETTSQNTLMSALRCKIALEENLDLPVDLLVKEPGKEKPIYNLAKAHGVPL